MSGNLQNLQKTFEAQFEAAGDDRYLYRRNQKGEPIPLTSEERERFIHQYVRRIRFILTGMMAALLVFGGLVIWRTAATSSALPQMVLYVGFGGIAVVGIVLMYWVAGAPARELEGRASIGRERSRDEMRAIFFKKISYGQLAAAAVGGAILPFILRSQPDVMHGWGRLWLLFGGSIVLLAAIQALRKWRFESDHRNDGPY